MAVPRPFGTGPYSRGAYSRYRGQVYDCAGSTGIRFDALSLGIERIIKPWAITQIDFTVFHGGLGYSWLDPAPCEDGIWAPDEPCETGIWATPDDCTDGDWTPATPETGTWLPPPGCGQGTWNPIP